MEIIWRSIYHSVLNFLSFTNIYSNQSAYLYNIKRIRTILTNDYGRSDIVSEVQSESEGSCSVAGEDVSVSNIDAEIEEFECPGIDEGEPRHSSEREPDGSQISGESSSSRISNDSHGSKSKVH